jgi:2-aminoadipate transaminase
VDADDVLVTNGAQEALSIAVQLIAASAPRIAVDPETYPGALDAFAAHGIEAVVEPEHADARYVMPDVSNPRGTGLDAAARDRVLEGRHPIIEDDAYADLRFDGPAARPLLATALGRVWHIGTFSKTFCPGLRVGWLVPPSRHLAKARAVKHDSDLQPNGLAQAVLEQILAKEDFDAHLARLRRFYAARARRLARGVRRFLPDWRFTMPSGGFALWLEAPDDVDEVGLLRAAIDAGVSFDPGSQFRPDHASRPTALRLCFSYVEADKLAIGVERLAEAWRRFLRTG